MYLSDVDIKAAITSGDVKIISTDPQHHPFEPDKQIRFASVDIRVGNRFTRYKKDVRKADAAAPEAQTQALFEALPPASSGEEVTLEPGEVLFAPTLERIVLSKTVAGRIVARSSFARLGLSVHFANDFINPGQDGNLVLQLANHNSFPVSIRPYMSICQLIIVASSRPASVGYPDRDDSRYLFESQMTPSRIALDSEVQRILRQSGLKAEDPSVRQAVAEKVQSQRDRQAEDMMSFLRANARTPADAAEIKRVLERYEESRGSSRRRLLQISWLGSGLFIGMAVWLLSNVTPVFSGKSGVETLYIPGAIFAAALVFTIMARTWKA